MILACITTKPSAFVYQYHLALVVILILLLFGTFQYSLNRSVWIMHIYLFFLFQAEAPPCKKNVHNFNECSSLTKLERTHCRWSAEESFYQDYNFIIQAVFLFHSIISAKRKKPIFPCRKMRY